MPDKQSDNKFMAMLERTGIVRKAGSEDESADTINAGDRSLPDADMHTIFDLPTDAQKVTPAARQPVPGLFNPTTPGAQTQPIKHDLSRPSEPPLVGFPRQAETPKTESPLSGNQSEVDEPSSAEQPNIEQPRLAALSTEDQNRSSDLFETEQPSSEEPQREWKTETPAPKPAIQYVSGANSIKSPTPFVPDPVYIPPAAPAVSTSSFGSNTPAVSSSSIYSATSAAPSVFDMSQETHLSENYTDRYLDIDELYDALSIKTKRTDTIYLIEEYLKTLPDSLPDESRREIVAKIVAASGFDFDLLMGDGVLRVKMLKEYAERFARHTEEYVSSRNAELDELEQQIVRVRRMVENRRELHKKQFFAIEAEAQRLKDILTFITG